MSARSVIKDVYVFPEEDDYEAPRWGVSEEQANETVDIDTLGEIIRDVYILVSTPSFVSIESMPEAELVLGDATSSQELKSPPTKIKSGQEWFWTNEWQAAERAVEEDLAAGDFEIFDTMEEFLEDLE